MKTKFQILKSFISKSFGLLLFVGLSNLALAQAGANDPTFNPTDLGFGSGDGAGTTVWTSIVQTDGKVIIGGNFSSYNNSETGRIVRLNTDGTIDASFNVGTGLNNSVVTVAIQPDGKILFGGSFISFNGTAIYGIVRLNTDGSIDPTFNIGTGPNAIVKEIEVQPDGKIIIGGEFTSFNGTAVNFITRLNANGSLDASFNVGANSYVNSINTQSDGKIIVGGNFTTFNGSTANRLTRINNDGSIDATFNAGNGPSQATQRCSIQNDGKIIIGGGFNSYNGTTINGIARLNSNGSLDASFTPATGVGGNGSVSTIAIQSDGKIIIGGYMVNFTGVSLNNIARLNTDGSLDATFNAGTTSNSSVYTSSIQADGKIIICGDIFSYDGVPLNYVARINTDGSLDASFNRPTGANNNVNTSAIQADGKIVIGGNFNSFNGTSANFLSRLNTDGSVDAGFNVGTGTNGIINTTKIQDDGKIIIGGSFTSYNGTTINRIARLNTNGSLDATFNVGTGSSNQVITTAIQDDGKIIIGGTFTAFNGTAKNRLARLNSDGSIDATFDVGIGTNGTINTTNIQDDGKIIIGGSFTSYNGSTISRIARINTDGSLDATFNVGTGADQTVLSIAVQADGKIIIGGQFTSYNGTAISHIARLNTDGSLDASFNVVLDNSVQTIALQPNGKIIIGGLFTSLNGTIINRVARLNTNGSLDPTFSVGTGANNFVLTSSLQADGNIVIGGGFTAYDGTGRNRVARILGSNDCETIQGTDIFSSCGAITWIDGNTYTASNNTATFLIEGGAANGCDSLVTLNLTVSPLPTVELTLNGSTLTASTGFVGYVWTFNGNPIAGATSNSIELGANGVYAVTATNAAGCEATDSFTHQTASLEENIEFTNVSLFPNPSQGEAILEVQILKPIQTNLKVTDIQGKTLIDLPMTMETGKQQIPLDLRAFESGVYFIQISANGTVSRASFVKQ